MRIFAAAAAALVAGVAAMSSLALPQPANAAAVVADITEFTPENVTSMLGEIGATNIKQEKQDGIVVLSFELGGLPYAYSIQLCNVSAELGSGCLGLLMAIGFEMPEKYNAEIFNSFNKKYPMATSVRIDDKTMALGRFMFSLGGLSRDNLKANMAVMTGAPEAFRTHLRSQLTVSLEQGRPQFTRVSMGQLLRPVRLSARDVAHLMDDRAVALPRR
jgi:hypothetical protein